MVLGMYAGATIVVFGLVAQRMTSTGSEPMSETAG
jgi:hypothetical protein